MTPDEATERRRCQSLNQHGRSCGTPPLTGGEHCLWHSPEHRETAQHARSLGGQRKAKEQATQVIFDVDDLRSLEGLERIYTITAFDTLQLENTPGRSRALIALMKVRADITRLNVLEQRLNELERAIELEDSHEPE